MSIVRIDSTRCGSYGWQARWKVAPGHPPLTKFLADGAHGGTHEALRKARWHEVRLRAQAMRERKRLNVRAKRGA